MSTKKKIEPLKQPNVGRSFIVNQNTCLFNVHVRSLDGTARVFRANVFTRGQRGLNANFRRFTVSTDGQNKQKVDTYNGTARITYDAGPVSLISVTSYWDGDATSVGDVDGGFGCGFDDRTAHG